MAARQLNSRLTHALRLSGVPVFTYHGVKRAEVIEAPSREKKYWTRFGAFSQQLAKIRQLDYRVRVLEELWSAPELHDRSEQSVVLTFDDGLESAYHVIFPTLREKSASANFFINTATVGKSGFLTWSQIKEMHAAGMSFQSHGHEHVYLSWLTDEQLARQLGKSKKMIEDHLGSAVGFLSCPYGDLDARVIDGALSLGFTAVCNSMDWPAQPGERTVNRVAVYNHTTISEFERLLTRRPAAYGARAAAWAVKYFPKRLLLRAWPGPAPLGTSPLETSDETSTASASFRLN